MSSAEERMQRRRGRWICALVYLVAAGVAVGTGFALRGHHPLVVVGLADLAATVAVFCASVIVDNSSMYDPYWSVSPVAIGLYLGLRRGAARACLPRRIVVLTLVGLWAVRLTHNWARSWRGLSHEDWRYARIRARTGRAYWPASLLGIHLMPTVMVFLGCLPLLPALSSSRSLAPLGDGLALLVTGGAIVIEVVADAQLHRFVRERSSSEALLTSGLWAYSRHPNYLGEMLFWWGLFGFALAADPQSGWTGVGALGITLLFLLISIPLIERRMIERKPTYAVERQRRPMLVPWRGRRR